MRIVLDLQACQTLSAERGIGRYSLMLAQAMARLASTGGRDHDLRIVLNNSFPDTIETIRCAFSGLVPQDRITLFDVPQGSAEMMPQAAWRKRAGERIREHYIDQLKPDVVHVASLFEGWSDDAVENVRLDGASAWASAITLYDLIPLIRADVYLQDPRVSDWYYRKLRTLKNSDLLLGISAFSTEEAISVLQLPAQQVLNISSAIDDIFKPVALGPQRTAELRSRFGLTRPFVMYTGGIDFRKNIEALIEAFAQLPLGLPKTYQLAIVCRIRQEDRLRLKALALKHNLPDDAVVLTDFVSDDDLVALYNLTTLFVFPSLYEGFGLPVLEAMACGAPVIGSNNSSIPEVVGRSDALFQADDTASITQKMAEVLSNEAMRDGMREYGLQRAKLFSWTSSATRALDGFEALHERRSHTRQTRVPRPNANDSTAADLSHRPRLALFSPLPPDKSGIADYTAELLRELTRYYEIDVIALERVDEPWIRANCVLRSQAWFEAHADEYDRIVYHFGNSSFHAHMFDLLERFPGVVDLHDFFLGGALDYLDSTSDRGALARHLYASHGYRALIDRQQKGHQYAYMNYPSNKRILEEATGVIVHSHHACALANQWYGPHTAMNWEVVPHVRSLSNFDRTAARQRLGYADGDIIICSFGILGRPKMNQELLHAWLASPLAASESCHLVFVGEPDSGEYGQELAEQITNSGVAHRITITGFAKRELYDDYLASGDIAVQLRNTSRGETSGTILDCLACGMPTIINAHGAAAELPDDVLIKLSDAFDNTTLCEALQKLSTDREFARTLARRAREYIVLKHHSFGIGRQYHDALERLFYEGPAAERRRVIEDVASISCSVKPDGNDLLAAAQSIALNQTRLSSAGQILLDITSTQKPDVSNPAHTRLEEMVKTLVSSPPEMWGVEPIQFFKGRYIYARNFTSGLLGIKTNALVDTEIEAQAGDWLVQLVDTTSMDDQQTRALKALKNRGLSFWAPRGGDSVDADITALRAEIARNAVNTRTEN